MNKSIYERALYEILEQRKAWGVYIRSLVPSDLDMISKALEQAQKQEKLLELYKELSNLKDDVVRSVFFDTDYEHLRIKALEIEKQIKELEK